MGPGAPSSSENTTGDQSYEDSKFKVGGSNERSRRISKKGALGTSPPPRKNAKPLEFSNDVREVVEKKESDSRNVSGERIPSRIVSITTVKEGFLAPVVKGASEVERNFLVNWSSLGVKSASEAVEEVDSASEGEASVSESSCYNTCNGK